MIHVLTPCSRPENLPAMHAAINACGVPYQWHVVFDAEQSEPYDFALHPNTVFSWRPSRGEGAWGNLQRNQAIDQVQDGYVYFCDDDNIPHPGLFKRALALQKDGPRIVIVNQIRKDGSVRLRVNGKVVLCGIDTAQAFIPHALIGDLRWQAFPNPADYEFLHALWERHRDKFVFLDENLSYYNFLRGPGGPP